MAEFGETVFLKNLTCCVNKQNMHEKNNDDLIVHVLKGSVKDEPSKHHTNQLDSYLHRRCIISCYP
jgi:hypothetical protein